MTEYDDIINLPHPVSKTHRPMPASSRAAQFAPFAALTGHSDAIAETARVTDDLADQSAEQLHELSQRMAYAMSFADRPRLRITYFRRDSRKQGGAYVTVEGSIKKVEQCFNLLTLTDNTQIALDTITEIAGDIFNDL